MADPRCHYCTRPAQEECPTCGRLYCAEHGEDVCLRCLAPEAAAPSPALYRGSILALAVGTLLTIFLLVRPPESESSQDDVRTTIPTPTPAVSATATSTPPVTRTPTTTPTPTPETPSATAEPRVHVVEPGDTLSGIAELYGTTVEALLAANPGLTEDLDVGQQIIIP
jgi:LysM repeat protein